MDTKDHKYTVKTIRIWIIFLSFLFFFLFLCILSLLVSKTFVFDQVHEEDREVLELKLSWEQQKHQFHQRIQDLESQLKEVKNSSTAEKEKLEHVMKI